MFSSYFVASGIENLKGLDIRETNVSDIYPLDGLENLKGVGVDYHIIGKNGRVVEKLRGRGVDVWWV
ncbi:MAG: hypothetical protein GWO20_08595 [Candidatus Korarchaeota archaeon]|nr:hypothetical protein [Candidatus Korarchaeota archaeon]NIU83446.1 hypothetical protein [Candidatus Thorarchaeota archaeon]NIW13722.1 hypothetical protein [Candidatus Thorarchaeota archaeon]NIW51817.1 hypothetical protein [Candidatus Korarchaeota archaeon]